MIFLQAILPLFTLVGTGYLLGRFRKTDPRPLSDVCLYVFIPVLLFASLVRYPLSGSASARIVVWFLSLIVISWIGVTLVGKMLGWDRPSRSAVILSLFSLNSASYGLPVVLFAFGETTLAPASLLVAMNNISGSSVGVYIAAGGKQSPWEAFQSIFKLPLIYGVIFGLGFSWLDVQLPERLLDFLLQIGKAGPIAAMVVLGIQFSRLSLRGTGSGPLYGGIASKLLLGPVFGVMLAILLGAEGVVRDTLFVYACMPTAISVLLLSMRYDTRPDLVGGIIFGSTVLSPLTVLAMLFYLT
jgi:hypothetical protein